MKSQKDGYGYNERLFSGGLRSWFHTARFKWFVSEITMRKCDTTSVLELGCFDGKLLTFFPNMPSRYIGYDANWEGGLDTAREIWSQSPEFTFNKVSSPAEMNLRSTDVFCLAVAMETLEHVPPDMVDEYLLKISQHLNGYFFITVPNEKGIMFLAKYCAKKIFSKDAEQYTFSEIVNATLGRSHLVPRDQHKGFDYESLIKTIERYFDVIDVSGHPLGFLPHSLCFSVGIVAKTKQVHW